MSKVRSETRVADEMYSMVKSFVTKGNLLTHQIFEGLAESRSLDDVVVKLKGTVYSNSVSRLQPPFTAHKLEMVFRGHLAEMHQALLKVAPKASLLDAYYLKFIAGDLKVLLKGRAQQKTDEEIRRHLDMHAEELVGRRDLVVKALSAENLDQAVEVLEGSEFAEDAQSALAVFKETGRSQVFDVYIDKAFYKKVLGAFTEGHSKEPYVRDIVAVDADSYNALAVLRGRLWDLGPTEVRGLLIRPFFDISEKCLKDMIDAEPLTEALKILNRTAYRRIISDAEVTEAAVSGLEDSFRILGYRRAFNPFLWDFHKTSIALGAVKLSELEVRNLSAVAFGVDQRLGVKDIMSRLVFLK